MNENKDQWIESVFNSMRGKQQAEPPTDLFAKIEKRIEDSSIKIIPLRQWKYAAAAAAIILLVNITALSSYYQNKTKNSTETMIADTYNQSLIMSYKIY